MRIVYDFDWDMPCDWPENDENLTKLVEDGDESVLYVDYQDKMFRRPMELAEAEELRKAYSSK